MDRYFLQSDEVEKKLHKRSRHQAEMHGCDELKSHMSVNTINEVEKEFRKLFLTSFIHLILKI